MQNHFHYLTEWWPFLWQDDGLALYQQLSGLQLPPSHDPGQSIPWLKNQQINIQTNWLTHQLSTLCPSFPTNSCLFYHNNKPVPRNISSAIVFFVVWNHIDYGLVCFHWLHNFSIAALQLPPAHDPGQSIPWLNNQQMNIKTHWLTHKLSTLSPQFPTKSCLFYHNNQPVPPDISSAKTNCCLKPYKW